MTNRDAAADESTNDVSSELQQRVLRVAAGLFAERGFHAVSVREIAARCNVSVSTVLYGGRTKQQLLEEILARSFTGNASWPAVLASLTPIQLTDLESLYRIYDLIVDKLLDHAARFPETRKLWIRLQLDQPELFEKLEASYTWPLVHFCFDLLRAGRDRGLIDADDAHIQLFVTGIDWCLNGYATGGILGMDGRHTDRSDPASLEQFRQFLHECARNWFNRR